MREYEMFFFNIDQVRVREQKLIYPTLQSAEISCKLNDAYVPQEEPEWQKLPRLVSCPSKREKVLSKGECSLQVTFARSPAYILNNT